MNIGEHTKRPAELAREFVVTVMTMPPLVFLRYDTKFPRLSLVVTHENAKLLSLSYCGRVDASETSKKPSKRENMKNENTCLLR